MLSFISKFLFCQYQLVYILGKLHCYCQRNACHSIWELLIKLNSIFPVSIYNISKRRVIFWMCADINYYYEGVVSAHKCQAWRKEKKLKIYRRKRKRFHYISQYVIPDILKNGSPTSISQ